MFPTSTPTSSACRSSKTMGIISTVVLVLLVEPQTTLNWVQLAELATAYPASAALYTMTADTWHRRVGHLGYDSLVNTLKVVDGVKLRQEDLHALQGRLAPLVSLVRRTVG